MKIKTTSEITLEEEEILAIGKTVEVLNNIMLEMEEFGTPLMVDDYGYPLSTVGSAALLLDALWANGCASVVATDYEEEMQMTFDDYEEGEEDVE